MCDTYVDNIGYICTECQAEFKEYIENTYGTVTLTEGKMLEELKSFMSTDKGFNSSREVNVSDFFSKHTH